MQPWQEELKRIDRIIHRGNVSPALKACSPVLHEGIVQNFAHARGPTGAPWPPRKDSLTHQLLVLTGKLYEAAANPRGSGHILEIGARELRMGVSGAAVPYAEFHQYGTRKMPARPFMYATQAVVDKCSEVFIDRVMIDHDLR